MTTVTTQDNTPEPSALEVAARELAEAQDEHERMQRKAAKLEGHAAAAREAADAAAARHEAARAAMTAALGEEA